MLSVLGRVLCGLLLCAPVAQADILAGKQGNAVASNTLVRFTDAQTGNATPAATFGGAASGLLGAQDMAWLQSSRELYVSDFNGQAIRIYNTLSGDAAPVRTITSPSMGQPRQLVLVPQHNELIVITLLNFVSTYALDANGSVAQIRQIGVYPNPVSGINNPSGLAYNPATDEIYVGDYQPAGESNFRAEVLVFPRTANGDVAPSRVIAGSSTQMGTYVSDLAINLENNELYVMTDTQGDFSAGILSTFAANGNGDIAPLRRITGNQTGLNQAFAITYDPVTQQLVAASDRENSATAPGLLFWPRTTNGNIAPAKIIRGDQTGTSVGNGWSSVLAVDLSFLFADGFE